MAGQKGRSGRPPKPTSLKVLHGDQDDRINHNEPVAPEAEVRPPDDLSDDAKVHWDNLAPSLVKAGVLTLWDVDAFAVVCEALARYKAATKLVNGSALLVQGPNGLVPNPALRVQKEAENTFMTAGARFGLTPSDRSKIKTEAPGGAASKSHDPSRLLG